jgi:hypothetical protein
VDYRYEYYQEDGDRMKIETHSVYFEQQMIDNVVAKGELVYDGISGATPTGSYDNTGKVITTDVWDIRRAANLELDWRRGNQTLTPGFAYSKEHDYQSYGISLNDAIEFNEKNTILQLGVAHNFDSVRQYPATTIWSGKDSTEGIIGISQLLSPKNILNVTFTFGNDSGYLNDPYRAITFSGSGFPFPEIRPSHRNKEVFFVGLTHYFDSVDASAELSYRFHHDSYDIFSDTVMLTWHQKLGHYFIVEPMFRCYQQSAASFYALAANGYVPSDPLPRPTFYSADYRLSELYTVDVGVQATAIINDHLHLIVGYHRYEMHGLDNTPAAAYPQANIFTAGLSILW